MKIWTFKEQSQFESLKANGELYGDYSKILETWDHFIEPYNWIKTKIPKMNKDYYPIWAWTKKPKLSHPLFSNYKNSQQLLIELEVPDQDCLLSCFSLWHCVLNDMVVCNHDNDKIYDRYKRLEKSNPSRYEKLKLRSWDRILNPKWFETTEYLQVCVAKIEKSQIKSIMKCGVKLEQI